MASRTQQSKNMSRRFASSTVRLSLFFETMYNKTIVKFGFCDIRSNQGLGKCYQPRPSDSADNTYLDLGYS